MVMDARTLHTYLERISNLLHRELRHSGSESGLQPTQLEALHYLSICNRYSNTPKGVTEYLGQTKGTVSQTLKVLERKEFLVKEVDKEDRRVIHLKITAKGKGALEKSVPAANFIRACQSLDAKTRQQLAGNLKTLLGSILQAGGSKSFGVCRTCRYNRDDGDGNFFCELVRAPLTRADVQLICREHVDAA